MRGEAAKSRIVCMSRGIFNVSSFVWGSRAHPLRLHYISSRNLARSPLSCCLPRTVVGRSRFEGREQVLMLVSPSIKAYFAVDPEAHNIFFLQLFHLIQNSPESSSDSNVDNHAAIQIYRPNTPGWMGNCNGDRYSMTPILLLIRWCNNLRFKISS